MKVKTSELILKSFFDFWKAAKENFLHYICKGGRASGKSTSISQRLILDLIKLPITILVIRKYEKHIRTSVFEQLKDAIRIFQIEDQFEYHISPIEIIYKARGNKIIFAGADDPQRIKGIKFSDFPIARLWIEEITEFRQEEEIDIITASFLRAKLPNDIKYKIYYSYNPPKRKAHWVNKKYESKLISPNVYVHHSTYLDNPHISDETLFDINEIKEKQPHKYKWMYLGEMIGGGIVPFQNLVFRKITDEEIKTFDNIKQGIDWGYSIHEFAFVRLHYDKTRKRIFFINEIFGLQLSMNFIINQILMNKWDSNLITADSAEPRSISSVRSAGIIITGARKGPGSIEFGEKWLNDLEEIIIDPQRTPGIAKEYEEIDYQIDANGQIKDKLNDKGNNTIDATRYALEEDMTNRKIAAGKNFF